MKNQSSESSALTPTTGEDKHLALAEAIAHAMSKVLAPFFTGEGSKDLTDKYKSDYDGSMDDWITILKRYLEKAYSQASELYQGNSSYFLLKVLVERHFLKKYQKPRKSSFSSQRTEIYE